MALLPPAPGINDPQGALYSSVFDERRAAALADLAQTIFDGAFEVLLDDYRDEGAALHCWLTLAGAIPRESAFCIMTEGEGETFEALAVEGKQIDQAALRIEQNGLTGRVSIRQRDFHAPGEHFEPESLDRFLFLESLCHAESYRDALAGAYRVLKKGSGLYIKDFHCVDNRARPCMAAGQVADLERLHSL